MGRHKISLSILLCAVVLILGWLVVRSVPAAESARLEASYRRDVQRWGHPDDWEWVRPPITGPAAEGTAAEWYGRMRVWIDEHYDQYWPYQDGLIGEWRGLRGAELRWVAGEEDRWSAGIVEDLRPALDLVGRGARTTRRGTARAICRELNVTTWSTTWWLEELIELGAGDAILLALDGEPDAAVDRIITMMRFAEDLGRCTMVDGRRDLNRFLRLLTSLDRLPPAAEKRLADALLFHLRHAPSIREIVGRGACTVLRAHRELAEGRIPAFCTSKNREGPIVAAIDDATDVGLLPGETMAAWRRTHQGFAILRRHAERNDDARLLLELRAWSSALREKKVGGVAERSTYLPQIHLWQLTNGVQSRLEREAILYGLRLREEWRRTGQPPRRLADFLPPGVRERPGGRPWILRPSEERGHLEIVWSGDTDVSFQIRIPTDPR